MIHEALGVHGVVADILNERMLLLHIFENRHGRAGSENVKQSVRGLSFKVVLKFKYNVRLLIVSQNLIAGVLRIGQNFKFDNLHYTS